MSGKPKCKAFHTGVYEQTGLLSLSLQLLVGAKHKLAHSVAEVCETYSQIHKKKFCSTKFTI